MKYKAILFDFDYTLGDSTKGIITSANYALHKLGNVTADARAIQETIGLSLTETYIRLTNDKSTPNGQLFSKHFKEKADEVMTENTMMLPFALDTLKYLKASEYKIGIVTTKLHYRINQILEKFHASPYVDMIIGADDVKIEKPDPEGLLNMISSMKLKKEEILYIGDSLVDAQTARNADVNFIGITTGITTKEEFMNLPHMHIIEDLSQLYVVLK